MGEAVSARRCRVAEVRVAKDLASGAHASALLSRCSQRGIPTSILDREDLDRQVPAQSHQGVVAFLKPYQYLALRELLDHALSGEHRALFLVLDQIQDPQNLGAIARSAQGARVDGLVIPQDNAVGVTPTVVVVSCGATEKLPICMVPNIAQSLRELRRRGVAIAGLDGQAELPLHAVDARSNLALVVGREDRGLRRLTRELCDGLYSIPLKGMESLNASAAAAIALYEVIRQRLDLGLVTEGFLAKGARAEGGGPSREEGTKQESGQR